MDQVKRIKLIGSSEADQNCQIKSACRVEIKFDGSSLGLFRSSVYARPFDRMPVEKHTCKHPERCSRLCFLLLWNFSSVYARPFFSKQVRLHPSLGVSSLAGDPQGELLPPAFPEKYNLLKRLALGTQGVTHTHTACVGC